MLKEAFAFLCTMKLSDGSYIYIEASSEGIGYKARLLSPTFNAVPNVRCSFRIWYHMYGSGIGTLNVYTKTTDGTMQLVKSVTGNQGDAWYSTDVVFTSPSVLYQNMKVRLCFYMILKLESCLRRCSELGNNATKYYVFFNIHNRSCTKE